MTRDLLNDWVSIPVRWSDMDVYRHVNNAKYMTYLEAARIPIYQRLACGQDWQTTPQGPVLGSITCNFRKPVQYPATLDIGTRVARIGHTSFHFEHGIFFHDTPDLAADARSVVIWLDRASGRPAPLPDPLRRALQELMHEPTIG